MHTDVDQRGIAIICLSPPPGTLSAAGAAAAAVRTGVAVTDHEIAGAAARANEDPAPDLQSAMMISHANVIGTDNDQIAGIGIASVHLR